MDVTISRTAVYLCAIPVAVLSAIVYYRFLHSLASIPGPFLASISRLWLVKHSRQGDMHEVMIALHHKHGPLVRTGPNEVSVSDLAGIKTIYAPGGGYRKSDWYGVWQGHRTFRLFPERDEAVHSRQRRLVSNVYSMSSLRDTETYIDDAIAVFMKKMEKFSKQNALVDMKNWLQLFAWDVIGGITFSKLFGMLEAEKDDGSFAKIESVLASCAWVGQIPALYWILDACYSVIGHHVGTNWRKDPMTGYAMQEMAERKSREGSSKDMLSKLIALKDEKSAMDDNAVTGMVSSNVFAGSDTTAISARAVIYYLLKNPRCKDHLLEEIDSLKESGQDIPDRIITYKEAEKMPYLQAVLHEALRLHPAVGMSLVRVVPEGGATIAGKYLPAGTNIGANAWVVHRDKSVYGDDVESFRPERWLEGNSDMQRFFLAFGAGSRTCIGRNISWMEMSKLVPTLLMRYEMELCEPKEWTSTCWWFVLQHELNVRLKTRA